MRIDSENIEEVIFDFHEGNLADEEKTALMDFIHKHPEYEREFVLWAKTYHSDKQLLDYGHNDRFVKKRFKVPGQWLSATVGVGLVIGVIYWWPSKDAVKTDVAPIATPLGEPWNEKGKATDWVNKEMERQVVVKAAQPVKEPEREESVVQVQEVEPTPLALDTVMSTGDVPVAPVVVDTIVTLQKEAAPAPPIKPVAPKPTKMKRRRKLDLTPSDDIVPVNSDL